MTYRYTDNSLKTEWRHAWNSVCMRATPSHTLYARTPRRQLKQFQFTAMADRRARVLAFCREQRSQDRRRSHHRWLSVQRTRVLNLRMRRAVKQSVVLVLFFLLFFQRVRKKWLGARRVARKAMRRAKNAWFERKAAAAQKGRNKGKVVWRCIFFFLAIYHTLMQIRRKTGNKRTS